MIGRLGVALATAALLAGCSGAPPESPPVDEPSVDLTHFYQQELAYGACEPEAIGAFGGDSADRAECATLDVPLDYANLGDATAQIAILRIPARGGAPIGSLVLNPGGPGFSGTSFAPMMAAAWGDSPITERFDLIGFDPRGVGASTPALDCYTDAQRESDQPLLSIMSGIEEFTERTAREFVRQCADSAGGEEALAHVGTRDVARDMDVLRAVLGDEKLTFVGASYGTRIGTVYAEMFGQNVRALVLDGAMDPGISTYERRVGQFTGMQRSFDNMAAFCAQQPDCPLGTDPAGATAAFQALARPLVEQPVPTGDGRELTFVKAVDGVVAGMYAEVAWPAVIQGIAELRDGRGDTLMQLRDGYHERRADGSYTNSLEANIGINCMDEDRNTPAQDTALKRAVLDAAPFADSGAPVNSRDACEFWPGEQTLRPLHPRRHPGTAGHPHDFGHR